MNAAAAGAELRRGLLASAAASGIVLTIAAEKAEGWASATFTGARHELLLVAPAGPALDRWLQDLCDLELPLRRMVVASMAVISATRAGGEASAHVEALTVEAA